MISIIIPVYNAEKTINRCIDSILIQNQEIEILLIDDGAQDTSGDICDQYARNNKNIKILHNTNHGVSYSRNCGLQMATGSHIMFIDSDDWFEQGALIQIYKKLSKNNYDLVAFNHFENFAGKQEEINEITNDGDATTRLDINRLIDQPSVQFIWDKVFKRSIISENNIRFHEDMLYGEDTIFLCQYLQRITSLCLIKDCIHHYWRDERGNSLSVKYVGNIEKVCDEIFEQQEIVTNIFPNYINKLSQNSYRGKLVWRVIMNNYNPRSERGKKERISNMNQYKDRGWLEYVINEWDEKTPLGKLFVILFRIGNFNCMDWVLWTWKNKIKKV